MILGTSPSLLRLSNLTFRIGLLDGLNPPYLNSAEVVSYRRAHAYETIAKGQVGIGHACNNPPFSAANDSRPKTSRVISIFIAGFNPTTSFAPIREPPVTPHHLMMASEQSLPQPCLTATSGRSAEVL